jgi:chromosome segregation ATPase
VRELKARARAVELAAARDALREVEAAVAASREEQDAGRAAAGERGTAVRAARDRLDEAEAAAREVESQLGRVRDENQAARGALESLRLALGQAAVTRTEREARLAEAAGRRERVTARVQRAEAEAAEDEARLAQVRRELEEFAAETRRLEEETTRARADLASRRAQLGTQADALHQQPGAEGVTGPLAEFRERAPSLEWPLVSVFRADDAKRSAIQAALGPFADAAIVETWAQARALLAAWREHREAPLALVVLEALGEPSPRGTLPEGALGWADELVECAPRHAALARALLGDVAIVPGDPEAAGGPAVASLAGVRWTSPGYVWWPGKLPVTAKTTGTELAMLLAAAVRELGGIEARIVELEADLAEARRFESAGRIEEARLSQRLQGRRGEREELAQTATESAAIEGRLREEIRALVEEQARLDRDLREREEGGDGLRRRQDELAGQALASQDAVKRCREALRAAEDDLEEARRRSETSQQAFVEAESRAGEARTRFELARHDFEAEFPGEAERIDDLAGRPLGEEEREELRRKESRLAAMGEAVNLLALEEFTSLKDRHAEYQKQIEDLRSSREKLQRAIYRLDRESERRFDETFARIRKNFHAMFRRLFGGGDADLRITENEEGERGIEIDAKPPGKRTQSIALLSGGERALTSTSLLFSLYLAKPSPFCFLDELDAPLDDANTDRFMKILKEFNDTTQFILITHNKHSMEMTDSLYGITMEEPGISKLVSVRLRQLPQRKAEPAAPAPEAAPA